MFHVKAIWTAPVFVSIVSRPQDTVSVTLRDNGSHDGIWEMEIEKGNKGTADRGPHHSTGGWYAVPVQI